ncbi:MAG: response regulator [Chloroflexi bacterium]|nr:response regulator [Chloroflexota bacterium]
MAKVLVVDDDPDFVEISRMVLESKGHVVSTAANGDQALERLRADKPDIILLDIMMATVLDGLDVSRVIREDPNLKDIPIVMVTSIANTPHAKLFPTDESLSVDGWISKPVNPTELLQTVERLT